MRISATSILVPGITTLRNGPRCGTASLHPISGGHRQRPISCVDDPPSPSELAKAGLLIEDVRGYLRASTRPRLGQAGQAELHAASHRLDRLEGVYQGCQEPSCGRGAAVAACLIRRASSADRRARASTDRCSPHKTGEHEGAAPWRASVVRLHRGSALSAGPGADRPRPCPCRPW